MISVAERVTVLVLLALIYDAADPPREFTLLVLLQIHGYHHMVGRMAVCVVAHHRLQDVASHAVHRSTGGKLEWAPFQSRVHRRGGSRPDEVRCEIGRLTRPRGAQGLPMARAASVISHGIGVTTNAPGIFHRAVMTTDFLGESGINLLATYIQSLTFHSVIVATVHHFPIDPEALFMEDAGNATWTFHLTRSGDQYPLRAHHLCVPPHLAHFQIQDDRLLLPKDSI